MPTTEPNTPPGVFGHRLRQAGILGSMGTVGDALDNAMAESFFATLQVELLDRRRWDTRRQLAQAIFEYIEAFYNPEPSTLRRRLPKPRQLSPHDQRRGGMINKPRQSGKPGEVQVAASLRPVPSNIDRQRSPKATHDQREPDSFERRQRRTRR